MEHLHALVGTNVFIGAHTLARNVGRVKADGHPCAQLPRASQGPTRSKRVRLATLRGILRSPQGLRPVRLLPNLPGQLQVDADVR